MRLRRLLALYIDFIIIVIISTVIVEIVTFGGFGTNSNLIMTILSSILYCILVYFLLTRKDLIFKNSSIGKKIFKICVYNADGTIPNKNIIIHRISDGIIFFPLEILNIIFCNETSNDKKFHTIVCLKEK